MTHFLSSWNKKHIHGITEESGEGTGSESSEEEEEEEGEEEDEEDEDDGIGEADLRERQTKSGVRRGRPDGNHKLYICTTHLYIWASYQQQYPYICKFIFIWEHGNIVFSLWTFPLWAVFLPCDFSIVFPEFFLIPLFIISPALDIVSLFYIFQLQQERESRG